MNQLTVGGIISNAFSLGLKNIGPILGAVFLWAITIWIPYINVGTTIGLTGLVVAMSKGNAFSGTDIFNPQYRALMGEYFLVMAFVVFGILFGYLFFVIPGIIISIAWGQATYVLLDKNKSPLDCIAASNKITHGKKWTIFGGIFLLVVISYLVLGVLVGIVTFISELLAGFVVILAALAMIPFFLGASAHIYGVLSKEIAS
ncbi:MAG: hypothetical protein ACRDGA_01120 [Bacteroidota bacterium]